MVMKFCLPLEPMSNGMKVEKAANKKQIEPKIFVDKVSENFVKLSKTLKFQILTLLEQLRKDINKLQELFGGFCLKIIKFI